MADASALDDAKTIMEIVGGAVTALAVVIGGGWALWRFGKERTYLPRLEVDLSGQWVEVDGSRVLLARIRVRNIGTARVDLRQHGTGLRISRLDGGIAAFAAGDARWQSIKVWSILQEHKWIEPSETVSDDLVVKLDVPIGEPVLFEARLVWQNSQTDGPIVVFARKVVTADETVTQPKPPEA